MWHLNSVEVNGGFLPGLSLNLPRGLTCIIGPRGSGKSTLAEIIRFAISGSSGASKNRLDLLQANLGVNGLVTIHAEAASGIKYTIKRAHKEQALITTADGRPMSAVDLDRRTFLPLDAYSFVEIESIADETLGEKRRALLDELRSDELHIIHLSLNEHKRTLDANADQIRSQRRTIDDLTERIEELADARIKLAALGTPLEGESTNEFTTASKQEQLNAQERHRLAAEKAHLEALRRDLSVLSEKLDRAQASNLADRYSLNQGILHAADEQVHQQFERARDYIAHATESIDAADLTLTDAEQRLDALHRSQNAELMRLTELNETAGALIRERVFLEQQIIQIEHLEKARLGASDILRRLLVDRSSVKALYLAERDRVSNLRQSVAESVQEQSGKNVRVRVIRNADDLAYRQSLLEGLKGARVRNHDDILESLLTMRPEQLAQYIETNDLQNFEEAMTFGSDRSKKILDSLIANLDPLELEVTPIEDRVRIELNVSTSSESNYKDAADLSRGQKCTALLPLLLARRDSPLIIDQPEDNLDNHFIYETVVDSIRRLKASRQMIFITHNANIPVLAEADLVVVMNSDGKIGYIEKLGTIDQCRDEVIDLLEGGKQAFALRSERYARA